MFDDQFEVMGNKRFDVMLNVMWDGILDVVVSNVMWDIMSAVRSYTCLVTFNVRYNVSGHF